MSVDPPIVDHSGLRDVVTDGLATADIISVLSGRVLPHSELDVLAARLDRADDPSEWALAASAIAVARYWDDTVAVGAATGSGPDERARLAAQAVAAARSSAPADVVARCQLRVALAGWGDGDPVGRRGLADEVLAHAEQLGRRDLEVGARIVRATDLLRTWSLAEFHAEVSAMDRVASDEPTGLAAWLVELWRGALSLLAGRLDLAASSARRAYDLAIARELPVRPEGQLLGSRHLLGLLRGRGDRRGPVDDAVGRETLPPSWALATAHRDARAGRLGHARHRYEQVARTRFESVPRNMTWPTSIVLAAETAIALDDRPRFDRLQTLLGHLGDDVIVVGPGHAVWGPAALCRSRLARAAGDEPRAQRWAEEALDLAPTGPFGALAELELSRNGRIVRPAEALAADFELFGMSPAAEAARRLPIAREPTPVEQRGNALELDGRISTFTHARRSVAVPTSVGLAHLAELLRRPGRELHALELSAPQAPREADRDDRIDGPGVATLRARLIELDEEIREESDRGRLDRLRDEFDHVTDHLARELGLAGPRHHTSNAERARSAVTKAIRRTIATIMEADRDLGRHFDTSIRTGTFCAYEPVDGRRWTVTGSARR